MEEKRRLLTAMSANVSPEGQRLFIAIAKMIQEVRWQNSDIVVFDQAVIISPPYQLENIRGNTTSQEYSYIRKVVEKHMKDSGMNTQSSNQVQNSNATAQ